MLLTWLGYDGLYKRNFDDATFILDGHPEGRGREAFARVLVDLDRLGGRRPIVMACRLVRTSPSGPPYTMPYDGYDDLGDKLTQHIINGDYQCQDVEFGDSGVPSTKLDNPIDVPILLTWVGYDGFGSRCGANARFYFANRFEGLGKAGFQTILRDLAALPEHSAVAVAYSTRRLKIERGYMTPYDVLGMEGAFDALVKQRQLDVAVVDFWP
jgi:hypothetical protein